MKCLIHTDFSTLVFGFSCLVFKKEKTEMGRSKGTEGTHQYKGIEEAQRVYSEKKSYISHDSYRNK